MTIDEIFAAMPAAAAEEGREYLVIDPVTRSITVPEAERIFGVESDADAARKYFICPRYVGDNLDLASMFLTVNYRNANGDEDGYPVDDVAVNGEYVTFSWQLWPKVVAYKGAVQFAVCADLPNSASRRGPDWNTTIAKGDVLEGLDPDRGDVEGETSDVVTALRAMVTAQTAAVEATGAAQAQTVKDQGTATTQEAVAAIKAQGAATQASLPADYTALAAQVDKLTRDRAAAIVCQAEGTTIQVQDASNNLLQGLRIFGRSTQDGTPTPDAPVEIVNTQAPVVSVYGENIFDVSKMGAHANKALDVADDGATITATGGGDKPYTSSVLQLDVDAIRGNTLIMTADSITNSNVAAKGGVQLNVHRGDGRDYEAISAESLTRSLYIGADVTDLYITIYTNNTANALGADNVVTVKGLRLNLNRLAAWSKYAALQSLTITTPGDLPGIPVASGGNYTDAAGQEWVCDEVDLARGVYVQRVGKYQLTGKESWAVSGVQNGMAAGFIRYDCAVVAPGTDDTTSMWSHFPYKGSYVTDGYGAWVYSGTSTQIALRIVSDFATVDELKTFLAANSVMCNYILAKPVERALTDAEIQEYRALQSYKPSTTVLNDAGAHMALEYAADPKAYIDNKLAALVAANS